MHNVVRIWLHSIGLKFILEEKWEEYHGMLVKSNQLCKSIWCLRIRGWRSGNFVWWIRRARSRSTGAWRWIKTRSHTIHITWKPSTKSAVVVGTKKKTLIETASPTCVYPSPCLLYTYQKQQQQYYQCTYITTTSLHPLNWMVNPLPCHLASLK